MVVVVMPSMVMETSLTTVLAEPPLPPDPELPPADCEDVSDVFDVADVDDVADVADIDDAAEDDVAAVDADAVTAALVEAIALIDMKPRSHGNRGRSADGAPCSLLQRGRPAKQAPSPQKIVAAARISPANISNQSPRHGLQLLPTCPGTPRVAAISARPP